MLRLVGEIYRNRTNEISLLGCAYRPLLLSSKMHFPAAALACFCRLSASGFDETSYTAHRSPVQCWASLPLDNIWRATGFTPFYLSYPKILELVEMLIENGKIVAVTHSKCLFKLLLALGFS